MDLAPGTLLDGKYRIVRQLAAGAMGVVYEGEHSLIHRQVAIKVMKPQARRDEESMKRFQREAQMSGLIKNDHVLEILDLGALEDGSPYMVMEFLDGESLNDRFERCGRLTEGALIPLIRQLLVGLTAAHRVHVIHRDLKPDNIFILKQKAGRQDFVKIIDFGVSRQGDAEARRAERHALTQTGAILGTPYYMSPEQARGASDIDQRSDLYAVGVVMYQGLTGRVPFEADSINGLLFNIATGKSYHPIGNFSDLDPRCIHVIERAMALDPADRFANAEEFIAALDAVEQPAPIAGTTARRASAGAGSAQPVFEQTDRTMLSVPQGARLEAPLSEVPLSDTEPAFEPAWRDSDSLPPAEGRSRGRPSRGKAASETPSDERYRSAPRPQRDKAGSSSGGRTAAAWERSGAGTRTGGRAAAVQTPWKIATFTSLGAAIVAIGFFVLRGIFGGQVEYVPPGAAAVSPSDQAALVASDPALATQPSSLHAEPPVVVPAADPVADEAAAQGAVGSPGADGLEGGGNEPVPEATPASTTPALQRAASSEPQTGGGTGGAAAAVSSRAPVATRASTPPNENTPAPRIRRGNAATPTRANQNFDPGY